MSIRNIMADIDDWAGCHSWAAKVRNGDNFRFVADILLLPTVPFAIFVLYMLWGKHTTNCTCEAYKKANKG